MVERKSGEHREDKEASWEIIWEGIQENTKGFVYEAISEAPTTH